MEPTASRACEPATIRPSSQRTVDPGAGALDADGPGALQQVHAPTGEVGFEHRRHLGVLVGEDLLAAHDERDLGARTTRRGARTRPR